MVEKLVFESVFDKELARERHRFLTQRTKRLVSTSDVYLGDEHEKYVATYWKIAPVAAHDAEIDFLRYGTNFYDFIRTNAEKNRNFAIVILAAATRNAFQSLPLRRYMARGILGLEERLHEPSMPNGFKSVLVISQRQEFGKQEIEGWNQNDFFGVISNLNIANSLSELISKTTPYPISEEEINAKLIKRVYKS